LCWRGGKASGPRARNARKTRATAEVSSLSGAVISGLRVESHDVGLPVAPRAALQSIDPATGAVVARIAPTPIGELPDILARSRRAQALWARQSPASRCVAIRRLGDALYARRSDLAATVTRETGKPHVEALFSDVLISLENAKYYARFGARLLADERVPHHNVAAMAKSGRLRFEPYGVIAIIAPWNYPLAIPMSQLIAAVAAGNSVILKPSELTPDSGRFIGECFVAAGFPADLLQVVQGAGEVAAALIDAHPDKVFFTGSVNTGRRVGEACARQIIPSVLELGGKDAMIVLGDADVEAASSAAVWGGFTNCGQACIGVKRIYAEESIARVFAERCVAKTKLLRLGPGSDAENEIAPMIRAGSADHVEAQLRDAVEKGAEVLTGGRRRPDLGANYFEPAVVAGVNHSMRVMREETFGPVIAIQTVANADEAVALANDSSFGLSASVWTRDRRRGRRIAESLRAGAVMVNDLASYFGMAEAPHGGHGLSGWGRTHSRIGLLEMVQVKYVDVDWLPGWPKAWWFGYNSEVAGIAGQFIDFCYAPGWWQRWRNAGAVVKAMLRGHRV
jgi:acyl-CoA reductase-like NAD-dependent aldehyde dehydrogenase